MDAAEVVAGNAELRELLRRGATRGYVLVSDLQGLHDPLVHGDAWLEDAAQAARDTGMVVVDDLSGEATPALTTTLALSTDAMRMYLDTIGRVPLLTAEEEVDLAKRDQAGRAAQQVLREQPGLRRSRRIELARVVADGRRAQEHMICANLRLVVSVARRYLGRGLSLLELVQEGNLGLIRGVEKFDHTKGYKFSTYATWWIRQALTRGTANKARAVRLPVHVHEMVSKIRRAELEFLQHEGRDATEEELAESLGLDVDRLREVRLAGREVASLDRPVGEDGEATIGDLVPDEEAVDPERAAGFELARAEVAGVLASLDERERAVVMLRFGLADGDCHTLEEIGERYGVTRERIRQIEKKTLAKLRHPSRSQRLVGLTEFASGERAGI